MNEQQNFWTDEYAQEYILKNQEFDLTLGVEGWRKMLTSCNVDIGSVLECGCNIGRNIEFLNVILPNASKSIIEISKEAFDSVTSNYELLRSFNGSIEQSNFAETFDLVFTAGVLIHIHPDHLVANMRKMFDYSRRYILMAEYFNRTPTMIEYQGRQDRLFKRDFGKLFIENFPVNLINCGFLWGHIYDKAGFDDTTWWLFEKR